MENDLNDKNDLNGKDVFVWFCRDADQTLASIEAYRHGEAEEPGLTFNEQIGKVFHAVEEYACTHFLLVCEKNSRYADFIKREFREKFQPRTAQPICSVVSEQKLESMLNGTAATTIYVLLDHGDMPRCLQNRSKYMFNDGSMLPWPKDRAIEELVCMGPAAWTRHFLLGSQILAEQLEKIRAILKAKGKGGLPQYVLITGETGTGKSFIAKCMAKICGDTYDDPNEKFNEESDVSDEREFLSGNCASLSPELADTLLFGAVKGAYTGRDKDIDGLIESAGDGILFLDEVGDLPLETQGKLLTALEEKSYYRLGDTGKERKLRRVKCNIIFGTNRNLDADAQEWESSHGRTGFRKDLLYRINSCHIELPPLRTRLSWDTQGKEVMHEIVERYCHAMGLALTDGARNEFYMFAGKYPWPGNFRDCKHLFEDLNLTMLGEGMEKIVSTYAMKKALERLKSTKTSSDDRSSDGMSLIDKVKARFPSPCDANDINFVFEVCRYAQSCADAGRTYYGTAQDRNFADAFKKRLAHYGLVFDRTANGHLAEKHAAIDVSTK